MFYYTILVNLIIMPTIYTDLLSSFQSRRTKLIDEEKNMSVGANITLDSKEIQVNNLLMQSKFEEYDYVFKNPQYFNFSHHYFQYKSFIEKSSVYKIIRQMPKGAALHVHSTALMDPDYMLNITYKDNLYVCFNNTFPKFYFSYTIPNADCPNEWQLMSEYRKSLQDVEKFDSELRMNFTLVVQEPFIEDINGVWKRFMNIFKVIYPILQCRPIWEQYFYDALTKFRNDKIMYIELRTGVTELYEMDGFTRDPLYFVQICRDIVQKFISEHPDFLGVKLIVSGSRRMTSEDLSQQLNQVKQLKRQMPDFVAGYDLVGQEDLGRPLGEFLPLLSDAKDDLNYFFHAGETAWYGTSTDENLIDAILLGSKRLGHAYALAKHPVLMRIIQDKNIALEVNVVSNSVLGLVHDVRNHPLATFLARGLPVVLSSDDPGLWEAEPLSHDFYIAFMGVASRFADLRMLKQLAFNSIQYSAMSSEEKYVAFSLFNIQWERFIKNMLNK